MSFATLVAALAVLPTIVLLSSANVDLQLNTRQAGPSDPNDIPASWSFVGCFSDSVTARTLISAQSANSQAMTPLLCTEFCSGSTDIQSTPFNFAGTEFSSQCFCDFNIQGTAMQRPDSACSISCAGDDTLTCGGPLRISVYQNHNPNVGPMPSNKPSVGSWTFQGCVTDGVNNAPHSLATLLSIPGPSVTVETCTAGCQTNGFIIAGLEFEPQGTPVPFQCWCGNTLLVPNITAPFTDCSVACQGDHTEFCGARNRLTIYVNNEP